MLLQFALPQLNFLVWSDSTCCVASLSAGPVLGLPPFKKILRDSECSGVFRISKRGPGFFPREVVGVVL